MKHGVLFVVVVAVAGCDIRPTLAQFAFFEDTRTELIEQCCRCLADRGTGALGASCSEAVVDEDGDVTLPADARETDDRLNDLNDEVDPGEVPCLCGGLDEAQCRAALAKEGAGLVVPGACIDQVDAPAPCESACGGVLSFDPVATE